MQICPEKGTLFSNMTSILKFSEKPQEIVMEPLELNITPTEEKKSLLEIEKESRAINQEKLKDADRPKKRFKLGK